MRKQKHLIHFLNYFCFFVHFVIVLRVLSNWDVIFRVKALKSGECFAPICAYVSRRHKHSAISLSFWHIECTVVEASANLQCGNEKGAGFWHIECMVAEASANLQ